MNDPYATPESELNGNEIGVFSRWLQLLTTAMIVPPVLIYFYLYVFVPREVAAYETFGIGKTTQVELLMFFHKCFLAFSFLSVFPLLVWFNFKIYKGRKLLIFKLAFVNLIISLFVYVYTKTALIEPVKEFVRGL